jgi:hypothetical protein
MEPRVHYRICRARYWFLNFAVCSFTSIFLLSFHDARAPSVPGPSHYRDLTITLRHTALGRNPPDEGSARSRDLYLTTHNTLRRQTSMLQAGFESAVTVSERPETHALDFAATDMGTSMLINANVTSDFPSTPDSSKWYSSFRFV